MTELMLEQYSLGQPTEGKADMESLYSVFVRLDIDIPVYIHRCELLWIEHRGSQQFVRRGQVIKAIVCSLPRAIPMLVLSHKASLPNFLVELHALTSTEGSIL